MLSDSITTIGLFVSLPNSPYPQKWCNATSIGSLPRRCPNMPIHSASQLPDSIRDFLTKQNQALLHDFSKSKQCIVAINPEQLLFRQRFDGWKIEKLAGCLLSSAFILTKPGYGPECWARWDYSRYRKAFNSYLALLYSNPLTGLSPAVQVDHLEPRIRFQKGDRYYVRLHLVSRNINASYGAGFEQNFYREERTKPLFGTVPMSWLGFCKATNIPLPGKNAGIRGWQAWARSEAKKFSLESGEDAAFTYAGMLMFLQLGYTQYYAGEAKPIDFELLCKSYKIVDSRS